MHRYGGVDLVKSDWHMAEFQLGATEDQSVPTPDFLKAPHRAHSIFEEASDRCRIKQRHFQPNSLFEEDRALDDWIGPLFGPFRKFVRGWDVAGVCHPYNSPPAVRRQLAVLVQGSGARSENASSKLHVSYIDAPLAACLGWLATGQYLAPANLLILDGTPDAPELTAIAISAQETEVQLRVCVSMELEESVSGDMVRARFREHISVPGDWRLCFCGERLADKAKEVASRLHLQIDAVTRQDEFSAATGAALFARFRHLVDETRNASPTKAVYFPGTSFQQIHVRHVFPYSLGVLGTGSDPSLWFWRRLFRAGDSLVATESRLSIGAAKRLPTYVMLAEYRGEACADSLWLGNASAEQTANGFDRLRMFTSAKLPALATEANDQPRSLRFEIQNPSGVEKWSQQTVKIL